jgi:hypothetical protein
MPIENPSTLYSTLRLFYTNKEMARIAGMQQSHMSKGSHQYPPPSTVSAIRRVAVVAIKDMVSIIQECDDRAAQNFFAETINLIKDKL